MTQFIEKWNPKTKVWVFDRYSYPFEPLGKNERRITVKGKQNEQNNRNFAEKRRV